MKRPFQSVAVLLSAALLTACALSPAAAVRREPLHSGGTGEPTDFQIRQSVPWRDGEIVYYTFDQLDPSGAPSECGFVAYTRRGLLGWQTGASGGGCATRGAATGPFERTGIGGSSGGDEGSWRTAYGLVTDPAAVEVRVTWSDGLSDTVALVDGSYLVVRAGEVDIERIEALDATGAVVATQTIPPPIKPPPPTTPPPARTPTPMPTAAPSEPDQLRRVPAPDGRWTAVVNKTAGSLDLQSTAGETLTVFPEGSTVDTVNWSPDSRHLLVVRTHRRCSPSSLAIQVDGPIEIWQIRLEDNQPGPPRLVFQSPTQPDESGACIPEQIVWGSWSSNNHYVLFWSGLLGASILADGLALWVLDVETGQVIPLTDVTLLNPRYQSWAPDGSALAFTAGGYRSAQVNKWLNLFDVTSGQVTTVVSETEQIPGIVAWSPRGDLIAYAAVPAAETGTDLADWMVFENPAIAGRRVYLLDPATGRHWQLNDSDAFQDAPTWSDDGAILYYVQREQDTMALLAADPATGQAQVVEGSRRPAPGAVGYYGQSKWDGLLAHRPEAPRATAPPLTETYTDPTYGYTLRYPAGWHVSQGWQSLIGWQEMPTLTSYPPDGTPPDLGPFSGQALIAIQVAEVLAGDLESLLDEALASPGPGQVPIPDRVRVLTAFDRQERTVDGRPAVRMETMGDFGTVNHVLVVLNGTRGYVLRGQGDGRVFDAVAEGLRLP